MYSQFIKVLIMVMLLALRGSSADNAKMVVRSGPVAKYAGASDNGIGPPPKEAWVLQEFTARKAFLKEWAGALQVRSSIARSLKSWINIHYQVRSRM